MTGADRPGLVEDLATLVADHGGNWERSRFAELAGIFAGVVLVSVPAGRAEELSEAIEPFSERTGMAVRVQAAEVEPAPEPVARSASLSLVGNDRQGIVRELSAVLARAGVSFADFASETHEAPMAGGLVFEVHADLDVPASTDLDALRDALEELGNTFMVDIDLE